MDNVNQVYYLVMESLGILNNNELGEYLKKMGSFNQKDLPKFVSEHMVIPDTIVDGDVVDRFTLNIPGAKTAFIDVHSIDDTFIYAKLFFLFGIHQFMKIASYEKRIDTFMHENNGPPHMQASFKLRPIIGPNCLVYNPGDAVIVTNSIVTLSQKEHQIHIYDFTLFDLMFGQIF